MPKFTWITIFLSVFITVTVTEIVIHEYSAKNDNKGQIEATNNLQEENTANAEATETKAEEIVQNEQSEEETLIKSDPKITEAILTSIKIENPVIKAQEFNGKIFDFLSTTLNKDYIIAENIFSNEAFIGMVYEFHFSSPINAEASYASLKNDVLGLDSITINENNNFGEKSFYLNNTTKQNTVYIITKTGNSIYGFKYPHTSHSAFKSLIKYL
jgi:hypothetical protein